MIWIPEQPQHQKEEGWGREEEGRGECGCSGGAETAEVKER